MKNYACLIIIFSLILSSCGTIPNSVHHSERAPSAISVGEKSCSDLVKVFFQDTKNENFVDSNAFKKKTAVEATVEELQEFNSLFSPKEFSENAEMFRSIFLFSKNDPKTRSSLLNEFKSQLNGNAVDEENATWKKFSYHKKKVDEKKKKIEVKEKSQFYEGLYYACKTQIKSAPTAQDLSRAKRLTYAFTAGSLGSSTITYSAVHWEEDKDSKWFNELYFSLGITTVFSFLGGKLVLANPSLNPWTGKMPITFLTNALSDAAVTGVYAALFKTDDKKLDKSIENLKNDPEAQEKIQELIQIAKEHNLFEKHLKETEKLFKDKKDHLNDKDLTIDEVDFDASRELLIAALAEKEYQDSSGLLATGNHPMDRYSFHRLFNLMSVPSNIGLSIFMYNQMCMTENPKQGFMKAVGIYLAGSIILDAMYFKAKKEAINQ